MTNNNDESTDGLDNNSAGMDDNIGSAEIQSAFEEIERLKGGEEGVGRNPNEELQGHELPAEEEGEDLDEQVVEEEPKKAEPKKEEKLWKVKKSKYRALAGEKAALQKVEMLEKQLKEALDSGAYHFSKTTHSELDKAKELRKKALEEGDADAFNDADIAFTRAVNNVDRLEQWEASHSQEKQPANNESSRQYNDEINKEIANDWIDDHPYLKPNSAEYRPELAQEVSEFVNYMDSNLAENGQQNVYFTKEYFDTIDQYIGQAKNRMPTEVANNRPKGSRNLESAGHVGGVRNSYNSSSSTKNTSSRKYILTPDERKICAGLDGVSEELFLEYKIKELEKGK